MYNEASLTVKSLRLKAEDSVVSRQTVGTGGRPLATINALVGGTTMETQVQVLGVALLHRVHDLLRHAHGEGQVAAHLPHHDGGADVLGLDLHVLPGSLLHHSQSVGPVAVASVFRAVGERRRQVVGLCVVHLLLHTLLEVPEDDCQLQEEEEKKRQVV
uniref:Uncharacterized protein n=1 Tax=Fundulus heteroclitus TaxID=8078 RepID=A0A3Q2NQ84_FUNHE